VFSFCLLFTQSLVKHEFDNGKRLPTIVRISLCTSQSHHSDECEQSLARRNIGGRFLWAKVNRTLKGCTGVGHGELTEL
jgi:hypothetical protein